MLSRHDVPGVHRDAMREERVQLFPSGRGTGCLSRHIGNAWQIFESWIANLHTESSLYIFDPPFWVEATACGDIRRH
jgi:hypothetical protein